MGIAPMMALLVRDGWGPGALLFGVLIPLAIIGLVAYGIWELARSRDTAVVGLGGGVASPASAILDERFARGEIDAEDYVARRNLLVGPTTSRDSTGSAGEEDSP